MAKLACHLYCMHDIKKTYIICECSYLICTHEMNNELVLYYANVYYYLIHYTVVDLGFFKRRVSWNQNNPLPLYQPMELIYKIKLSSI